MASSTDKPTANPFLLPQYGTPFHTIPFSQIALEHYEPAIVEGIRQEEQAIAEIVACRDTPTFDNVIAPCTDALLERVTQVLFNLASACTSDELDQLVQRMTVLLSEHANKIALNQQLFRKIEHVYNHRHTLLPQQQRLTEKAYKGMLRQGANLSEAEKDTFSSIQTELAQCTVEFEQRVLKEMNNYQLVVTDEALLAGLPQRQRDLAAEEARSRNVEGWVFTLHAPSINPFLTYAHARELRQQMYMARNTLCYHGDNLDNANLVRRILHLRMRKAQMLGYQSYAEYILEERMAGSTKRVYELWDTLLDACLPVARAEVDEVAQLARQSEGDDFELQPWDFAYYSHLLKVSKYQIDQEQLRPYFALECVQEGIFGLAHTLYGIEIVPAEGIEVYHPDVKAYEVRDQDGTMLAVLYTDFFPRANKQGGAWMTQYRQQQEGVRPIVSLCANFMPPTAGRPSLLSLDEVETFLHEFGHCLHGIFSDVRYRELSGTNVLWDFVELPSQVMENYATEPQFLHTFARHYQTGEEMPGEYVERIVASRRFHAAYGCVRQVGLGLLDMGLHSQAQPTDFNIERTEERLCARTTLLPHAQGCCLTPQFTHIMSGGYAAGYYSYLWAEVMDADVFAEFRRQGIFNAATAQRFRQCILSQGDTRPPMQLYTDFRHQEPSPKALLERIGVNVPHPTLHINKKKDELDARYLRMAHIWSENSYCHRRQVGALIVKDKMIISDGYNGTPSGFENVCEDDQNVTHPYVLHAEANAITKIARSGNNSAGSTLYVTDSPCIECAKLIIQAGIRRVVYDKQYRLTEGVDLLRRAGVDVCHLPLTQDDSTPNTPNSIV